jgi:hypothetical protein
VDEASMKKSVMVVETDFGAVTVDDLTLRLYEQFFFRKKAPKKSKKEAIAKLEQHVFAMADHAWVMGDVLKRI